MVHSDEVDFLVTGNDDGSIRLWNADSGSTISLTGLKTALQLSCSLGLKIEPGDIGEAFCQGNKINRKGGRIFARTPAEGLAGLAGGTLVSLKMCRVKQKFEKTFPDKIKR